PHTRFPHLLWYTPRTSSSLYKEEIPMDRLKNRLLAANVVAMLILAYALTVGQGQAAPTTVPPAPTAVPPATGPVAAPPAPPTPTVVRPAAAPQSVVPAVTPSQFVYEGRVGVADGAYDFIFRLY